MDVDDGTHEQESAVDYKEFAEGFHVYQTSDDYDSAGDDGAGDEDVDVYDEDDSAEGWNMDLDNDDNAAEEGGITEV